jgi:GNAT superfamily N-acetyltransferase
MTMLRPLSVDDLSAARYIHASAFSGTAADHYAPADIEAFVAFVRSPHYGDLLLGNHAIAAWIESEMVGTAAWSPGEGMSPTARLLALSVRPLFTGEGIGRQLLEHVESEVEAAGFRALEVAATFNTVSFFDGLGFRLVREDGWRLPLGYEIPVAIMRKAELGTFPLL